MADPTTLARDLRAAAGLTGSVSPAAAAAALLQHFGEARFRVDPGKASRGFSMPLRDGGTLIHVPEAAGENERAACVLELIGQELCGPPPGMPEEALRDMAAFLRSDDARVEAGEAFARAFLEG